MNPIIQEIDGRMDTRFKSMPSSEPEALAALKVAVECLRIYSGPCVETDADAALTKIAKLLGVGETG